MRAYIFVEEAAVRPELVVRNLNISAEYAEPRQAIQISADVINEGGGWGSAEVVLLINGYLEQSVDVGVSPGTAQPINFTVYKTEAGEYQVQIMDATATFYVMEDTKQEASKGYGPLDTGGIVAIVIIVVIIIAGVILAFLLIQRTA